MPVIVVGAVAFGGSPATGQNQVVGTDDTELLGTKVDAERVVAGAPVTVGAAVKQRRSGCRGRPRGFLGRRDVPPDADTRHWAAATKQVVSGRRAVSPGRLMEMTAACRRRWTDRRPPGFEGSSACPPTSPQDTSGEVTGRASSVQFASRRSRRAAGWVVVTGGGRDPRRPHLGSSVRRCVLPFGRPRSPRPIGTPKSRFTLAASYAFRCPKCSQNLQTVEVGGYLDPGPGRLPGRSAGLHDRNESRRTSAPTTPQLTRTTGVAEPTPAVGASSRIECG
jgi:hypothetical protein